LTTTLLKFLQTERIRGLEISNVMGLERPIELGDFSFEDGFNEVIME
jgi:hypothetical protein